MLRPTSKPDGSSAWISMLPTCSEHWASGYAASFDLSVSIAFIRLSASWIVGCLWASSFGRRLQVAEELGNPQDRDPPEALETQEVRVAAHNHLANRRNGTFQDAVVGRVSLDYAEVFGRLDEPGNDKQLLLGFGEPFRRSVEPVSED